MTQPTDTFSSYDAVGNREDLTNVLSMIDPTETPFQSAIGRTKAKATYHEWQTQALAAAAQNKVIEGDDATTDATTATVRLGNYTQISDKVPRVTGTQEVVDKAGRDAEMAYQIALKMKEIKRDMENDLCGNYARAAGSDSVARVSAGIEAWIATNDDHNGTSPTGNGTDTRTDGTQRAFTETMLKTTIRAAWEAGGEPDMLMVGAFNKQQVSLFTGGATRFDKSEDKRLVAAIDLYESDFGTIKVVPNRFSRSRSAPLLDTSLWKMAVLRPLKTVDLAKTGDTERKQLIIEYTLECRNEKGNGGVFDLTTS